MQIKKSELLRQLNSLKLTVESEIFKDYLKEINGDKYSIQRRIQEDIKYVQNKLDDIVDYYYQFLPNDLDFQFKDFCKSNSLPLSNSQKSLLGIIIKRYTEMLSYCHSLSKKKIDSPTYETINLKNEYLENRNKLTKIQVKILTLEEKLLSLSPSEKVELNMLREDEKELSRIIDRQYEEIQNNRINTFSIDSWDEKIKNAFYKLSEEVDILTTEATHLKIEFRIYVVLLIIPLFVAGFCFYTIFKDISWISLLLKNPIGLLPYYSPLPFAIALFWVLIVQKNRAQKLYIQIEHEIFNLNYLKSLLLMVNQLSNNREDAINTIHNAVNKQVDYILSQIDRTQDRVLLKEKEFDEKEINELNKFAVKLTELVKK